MIWSLPNGMQAYTLANAAAARLDEADKSIVRDPRQQNERSPLASPASAATASPA